MKDDWNSPERVARSEGYAAAYVGVPRSKAPKKNLAKWIEGYEAAEAAIAEFRDQANQNKPELWISNRFGD